MNPFEELQAVKQEIKELDEERKKILDKSEGERSGSEVAFLNEYKDKLADLKVKQEIKLADLKVKELDEERKRILDKREGERSGSEVAFLNEYKDKLAELKKDKERWFKLVEDEKKIGTLLN